MWNELFEDFFFDFVISTPLDMIAIDMIDGA